MCDNYCFSHKGEVILTPTVGEEFTTSTLPEGWLNQPYGTGGNPTFNNGWLMVDGSAWSDWQSVNSPIASPNGRYLEYRATLSTPDGNVTPELQDVTITYELLGPSAVDTTDPLAIYRDGGMSIEWRTAHEINLIGFNVYRSTNPLERGKKLNDTLILGQQSGEAIGAEYVFIDETAQQGVTYYYWIERITTRGAEMIGPALGLWEYRLFLTVITGR